MSEREARIARGDAAAQLLASETFQAAMLAVDNEMQQAVFRTALAERDKREAAFAEWSGLRATVTRLRRWAEDAAILRAEADKPDTRKPHV